MANHSVVVMEKPLPHLGGGLADWHSRLTQLRNVADSLRNDAFDLRHTARSLRNETRIQSEWDAHNNNGALVDRVSELERWRYTVQACLDRIEREMKLLRDEKASTEIELENLMTSLLVVSECLTMRDCRLGAELTYDDGDTELKKELCVVENSQRLLRDQCQAAWEKLNRLEDVKFKLGLEIANKEEAANIDTSQVKLTRDSDGISFKPDATRIPKDSCTYAAWLEHTRNIKQMADNEHQDTYAIRESLFVCREKARNVVKAQQDRTEHIIRKRIFETQRAKNELEWQLKKMREEMDKCLAEIGTLTAALADKTNLLKLAETRLENRTQRAGMELCLDEVYHGLCNEVHQLRNAQRALRDQINCAKTTYNRLEEHEKRIETDLHNKEHSLMVDVHGLDLRARLKSGELNPTQTDRNIELTKMEKGVPPT